LPIALDATYSAGSQLTGVGVYCREILHGLAAAHPTEQFHWTYRPHRLFKSFTTDTLPRNCSRRLLLDALPSSANLFHGMNQRLPRWRAHRMVTTFHDLFVMTSEYSTSDFRSRFAALARDAADRSDLIIAVSQFTAEQVSTLLRVEPARLRVVHHGVHCPRSIAPVATRERIVLHVGAIQTRKNTARLIEAFKTMPQSWRLVLAGSKGYGAEEMLRDAGDRVEVTGYVSALQLADLYRRASIFAFPSLDEGFGIPVLEAMAHGVPVIASNTSALPEVCADAALFVDPREVNEISAALTRLADDTSLREDLQTRGRARALAFPWSAAVEKTWDVYSELLG
jgi:glycosyltransferase involved in cell wall biosynthesis